MTLRLPFVVRCAAMFTCTFGLAAEPQPTGSVSALAANQFDVTCRP
jgi:hypothetical protein